MAWWNACECGGFDLTDVWGVDTSIAVDMMRVFALLAGCHRYPDVMGYGKRFEAIARGLAPGCRSQPEERNAMIEEMEPLHISEADAVRDLAAILKRVQAGAEVVIERDAQPLAVIRAATRARRTISECIALAEAHEKETGNAPVLDADFAADVEEIVRNRKPWNPPTWG